jgi:hypothetical protein
MRWVAVYNTGRFMGTGDLRDAPAGRGPSIINNFSGQYTRACWSQATSITSWAVAVRALVPILGTSATGSWAASSVAAQ